MSEFDQTTTETMTTTNALRVTSNPFRRVSNHLFVGTKVDTASMNIAKHLIKQFNFEDIPIGNILNSLKATETGNELKEFVYRDTNIKLDDFLNANHRILYHKYSNHNLNLPTLFSNRLTDTEHEKLEVVDSHSNAFMWITDYSSLKLNYPNVLFQYIMNHYLSNHCKHLPILSSREIISHEHGLEIDDVFFISRHSAQSGTVSLTVHPIGIPHVDEPGRYGGLPFRCSPPNTHIASLYRTILDETKEQGFDQTFTITLEATHHGPFVEIPTCFVEIGSAEPEWSNLDAGRLWSNCLGKYFGLYPRSMSSEVELASPRIAEEKLQSAEEKDQVPGEAVIESDSVSATVPPSESLDITKTATVMMLGGGHYVPRLNDMARFSERFQVAHALATYCLEAEQWEGVDENGQSKWRRIICEAINSTRIAFPGSQLLCFIEKKPFSADQKEKIQTLLDEEGIQWTYKTADIRRFNSGSSNPPSTSTSTKSNKASMSDKKITKDSNKEIDEKEG